MKNRISEGDWDRLILQIAPYFREHLLMSRILKLILALTVSMQAWSQGISNLWLMGKQSWYGPPFGGVDFDFYGGSLNINWHSRVMNFNENIGVICDKLGDFLFSSNGVWIANRINDTLVNGAGLNPGPWTSTRDSFGLTLPQGNLILPMPNNPSKYYLFHQTIDDYGVTFG